jgi:hypothetical protein
MTSTLGGQPVRRSNASLTKMIFGPDSSSGPASVKDDVVGTTPLFAEDRAVQGRLWFALHRGNNQSISLEKKLALYQ